MSHKLTHPPTKPNTHLWVEESSQISNLQKELKHLDSSNSYCILTYSGGPPMGWVGVTPHTYTHTCIYTCAHTCMHVKHGCLHGGGHLQFPNMFILLFLASVCMHMCVHVSGDTSIQPPTHPPPGR